MEQDGRLEGELHGFTYRAADGSFAVARVRVERGGEVTAVGPIGHVTEGQHLALEGRWIEHPQFGKQFKVQRFLVEDPRTRKGLERYLSSGAVHGLGPEFARRVVEHFGLETLRIIEEQPDRLLEVKGIGKKRLAEIVTHWERDQANRELHIMLRGYGVGPAVATRIVDAFGKDALTVLTRDPYRLAGEIKGIGFRTADVIARGLGIAADDPARAAAALLYVLDEGEGEGHCFLPEEVLLQRAAKLEIPAERLSEALERLAGLGQVVRHAVADPSQGPVYRARMDRCEARAAARLIQLDRTRRPGAPLGGTETGLGLRLNHDQRRAVDMALTSGVSVITGGPGTGKTTIVRVLINEAISRGERWLLAAPTGRAARRLGEATGQEAKTLHRLLEYTVRQGRFGKCAENPLEADGVLIDEASMVDLPLLDALLAALSPGTRLVMVGDADQLPSVGPGRVLGDLISCGALPVATLTEVYRQARDSGIVRNAHRINQGWMPVSTERDPEEGARPDFYVLEREDPLEVVATLLRVVQERLPRLGFNPLTDVQVITPVHAGGLGTDALNHRLQDALNPRAGAVEAAFSSERGLEMTRGSRRLRVGDRVIQVRNNYDNDVFNGDVGLVVGADEASLDVDFEGRRVALTGEQLQDVELAWAISIHKSQGSEYPAVVVVLHRSHRVMLRRNLLYTGITRAARFCCLIGDRYAIELAVQQRGGDERWTRLAERLELIAATD